MQLTDVCSMPPVPGSVHEEVQFARESGSATHPLQFLAPASSSASHLVQCSRLPRAVRRTPSSGSSSPREVARTDRKSSSHATPVEFNVRIHGTRRAAPFPAASFEARTVSAAPGTCRGTTPAEDGVVVLFFPQQQKLPCVYAIVEVHGYFCFFFRFRLGANSGVQLGRHCARRIFYCFSVVFKQKRQAIYL